MSTLSQQPFHVIGRGVERRDGMGHVTGTTEYVVYGLNRQNNYCFSVAVVYTVDQVAASEAVCTKRK